MTRLRFGQLLKGSGILASSLSVLATRIASVLIGIVLSVLLARVLGADGFGEYLYTITIASFLALPVLAGLPTLVIREIAIARGQSDDASISGIIRWSIAFVLITSAVVGIMGTVFLISTGWLAGIHSIYALAFPLIIALGFMQLAAAVLQGYERPFLGNLPDGLLRPFILLTCTAIAAAAGALTSPYAVLLHIAAASFAALWAALIGFRIVKKSKRLRPSIQPVFRTQTWLVGLLPLSLITGASLLNSRLDILMLGALTNSVEVARYGIAVQVAGLVLLGQTIVNGIVQPKIARLFRQNERQNLRALLTQAARLSSAASFSVMIVVVLLGDIVILTLVGIEYAGSVAIMLVLSLGKCLNSLMGPVGNTLNMTGNATRTAVLTLSFSIVNAALNLALIPVYGAVGAAFATSISLLCLHAAMVFWARRVLRLDTTVIGMRLE